MKEIYLASQSPRRRQLLEKAGVSFKVLHTHSSEDIDKKLITDVQILSITRQKLDAATKILSPQRNPVENSNNSLSAPLFKYSVLIIAADTEVVFDNLLLGKPKNEVDAVATLKRLSGKRHEVKTGVIVFDLDSRVEISHIETSFVHFKSLSEKTILDYVKTGEPFDKAGSYAIQGLGQHLVEKFDGSVENIIGLPTDFVVSAIRLLSQLEANKWN